ncbi:6-phosphofructokinase (macronuclear) [Tetrahymena thermophila SB210]|uniref:6-phosphofructokinase n=1 Tax=Tetrahymena thermophila (strain SB210) TaxID=312017 RepID=I7LV76_TETTS|nr:6-phosphofructokinase [Tetrahymena thermophila SB210]EAR97364.2 6-phosphofructokinase [Tetrahymena thermophila SB210]|eukprot:XP_001017609.2 6-phosphofructokinase [Tetrahymena thermophila SB210]
MEKNTVLTTSIGVSVGVLTSLLINYLRNQKAECKQQRQSLAITESEQPYEDDDAKRRKVIQELIKTNKGKYKEFHRLKIKDGALVGNSLLDEIRFLDSALCEIEKVPNLIIDLGLDIFEEVVNPIARHTHKDTFINTNSFILSYAAFGPSQMIQNAKRWLRAGPRYHNYFRPDQSKVLIVTQDGLCPGLNVVIREIVMHLNYNYQVEQIYGAKFGWKGIYEEDWVQLIPSQIKTIHHRGGTFIGTSRTGFDRDKIIETLIKHNFNQLYVICGNKSMGQVLELYYEIRRRKLNIGVCNIPRSVDNDIPIIDESFGYQSCVEEAQRVIDSAWVESRSHRNGVGIIRVMGQKSGFIAMGACLASRCVNVCLIPEFNYDLYGKSGVLDYIKQRIIKKGHCIVVVSEGANSSFADADDVPGDVGKFLQDEIQKFCAQDNTEVTVKYFDPLYMLRAVRANAYDTKQCSTLAQNAVHGLMAGFTGFSIGHVHNKTCFIPLEEMLSGNYRNRIVASNKNWQRLLASTGQPSFINEEELKKIIGTSKQE